LTATAHTAPELTEQAPCHAARRPRRGYDWTLWSCGWPFRCLRRRPSSPGATPS